MKKIVKIFYAFIAMGFLVVTGCLVTHEEPKGSLVLKVISDSNTIVAGDQFTLRYLVKNESGSTIYIPTGEYCLGFNVIEFPSEKRIALESLPPTSFYPPYFDKNYVKCLDPSEAYEYEHYVRLSQDKNGDFFLKYYGDTYRVPSSGVIIRAHLRVKQSSYDIIDSGGYKFKLYARDDLYSDLVLRRDGCVLNVEK